MADLSVYQRLVPLAEAQKQNEMQALQKQLIQANITKAQNVASSGGGNTPAALQIANKMFELEKTFKNPQVDPVLRDEALRQYNLIGQAAKTYGFDRGITYGMGGFGMPAQGSNLGMQLPVGSPQVTEMPPIDVTNQVVGQGLPPVFQDLPVGSDPLQEHAQAVMQQQQQIGASPMQREDFAGARPIPGYGEAVGSIAAQKKRAETQAAKEVELMMQPQIEAAKKAAEIEAEDKAKAKAGLSDTLAKSEQMIDLLNQIEQSPGLEAVVGVPNPLQGGFGIFNLPGSPAADFRAKLDQLGGKQFLEAFESLKGGGQITEIEGEKATNAIARMQTSQSEQAFRQALQEFKEIVINAANRARQKAGMPEMQVQPSAQQPAQSAPQGGFKEGQTAVNPQTGQKIIYMSGKWRPL